MDQALVMAHKQPSQGCLRIHPERHPEKLVLVVHLLCPELALQVAVGRYKKVHVVLAGDLAVCPGKMDLLHADKLRAELLHNLIAEGVDRVFTLSATTPGNFDRCTTILGVLKYQDLVPLGQAPEDECSRPVRTVVAYVEIKHLRPPF